MRPYNIEPLEIYLNAPNGTYEVTVNLKAHNDTVITIYAQDRSFIMRDVEIKASKEYTKSFAVSVCDRHFHGADYEAVTGIRIQLVTDGDITATAFASPVEMPTIYICGGSETANQPAAYPYSPAATFCGWGQALSLVTNPTIAVSNHAQNGSRITEFISSNLTAFEEKIQKGDYLVIDFGDTDPSLQKLALLDSYKGDLLKLAETARSHGAEPIICSPVNRFISEQNSALQNSLKFYRDTAKEAAAELGCAFVDLWQRTTDYFMTAGAEKVSPLFRKLEKECGNARLNDLGGTIVAQLFARELLKQNGALAPYINKEQIESI